ncbi:MAG: ABC transporter substrate-binding protein, partial [Thiohalocapsa sp.]
MTTRLGILLTLILAANLCDAVEPVRVGLLKFGTVNWEMAVVQDEGLDRKHGVEVEVTELASTNAVNVALQGGAVDLIVGDWIWVNRQRAEGRAFSFFPYSLAVGGLYARPDAGIDTLAALKGRKLGIAGGPVDKSWLLLQARARSQGWDIAAEVEPVFGAPPLLNQFMLAGDLPAVLNYWHFGARLRAQGMRELIRVPDLLRELGVTQPVPMLGWVFAADWAERNPVAIRGFLAASYEAKRRLASDDALWQALRARTKAEDDATLVLLRDGYRGGIPANLTANGEPAAAEVFGILAREGGAALVGNAE